MAARADAEMSTAEWVKSELSPMMEMSLVTPPLLQELLAALR
jgi:hypothetical protein